MSEKLVSDEEWEETEEEMKEEAREKGWEKLQTKFHDSSVDKTSIRAMIAERLTKLYDFKTPEDTEEIFVFTNPIYEKKGKQLIRKKIHEYFSHNITKHDIDEIIDKVKISSYIERPKPRENKRYIALKNGWYDLEEDELVEPDPDVFLTSHIPIKYDEEADCPKIKEFLHDVVENEDVRILQELIGYCLYKDYPIQKAFMLLGSGSNGKSAFLDLVEKFLGEDNVASPSLQQLLYDRFKKIQLYGKLANIHADLSTKKLTSTGTFKMLTGGDTINGEKKYIQDTLDFKNHAKLIYSANELPRTEDTTDAFFRRWEIVRFPYKFTDEDDENKDKNEDIIDEITTEKEMSGLFNWAIEGLKRLLDQGHFSESSNMEEIKEKWMSRTNPLEVFVEEHCELDPSYEVSKEDFMEALNAFCREVGAMQLKKQAVTKKLPQLVPSFSTTRPEIDGERVRCYKGLKIKEDCNYSGDTVQHVQGISNTITITKAGRNNSNKNSSENTPDSPDIEDNNTLNDYSGGNSLVAKNYIMDKLKESDDPLTFDSIFKGYADLHDIEEGDPEAEAFYQKFMKLKEDGKIAEVEPGKFKEVDEK